MKRRIERMVANQRPGGGMIPRRIEATFSA
jgi:hypothetical protein